MNPHHDYIRFSCIFVCSSPARPSPAQLHAPALPGPVQPSSCMPSQAQSCPAPPSPVQESTGGATPGTHSGNKYAARAPPHRSHTGHALREQIRCSGPPSLRIHLKTTTTTTTATATIFFAYRFRSLLLGLNPCWGRQPQHGNVLRIAKPMIALQ